MSTRSTPVSIKDPDNGFPRLNQLKITEYSVPFILQIRCIHIARFMRFSDMPTIAIVLGFKLNRQYSDSAHVAQPELYSELTAANA